MQGSLQISIPYALARYAVAGRKLVAVYETNQLIRALDTWLILKSISRPSLIQQWNRQKQDLFSICKCSETIFRHRLRILVELKLVQIQGADLRLVSWQGLEDLTGIDTREKFTIQYNEHDEKKIYQWLIATEIKDNQARQAHCINAKVKKNPELNMILIGAMIRAGADRTRLNDPGYFLTWLQILYQRDFVQVSEIHQELIAIRPDTNRGVKGIAAAWNARHPMTATYWKKVLQRAGIIDVAKLAIQSQSRARNENCVVRWLKKEKQTLLILCDQVTVLEPWLIENLLAA